MNVFLVVVIAMEIASLTLLLYIDYSGEINYDEIVVQDFILFQFHGYERSEHIGNFIIAYILIAAITPFPIIYWQMRKLRDIISKGVSTFAVVVLTWVAVYVTYVIVSFGISDNPQKFQPPPSIEVGILLGLLTISVGNVVSFASLRYVKWKSDSGKGKTVPLIVGGTCVSVFFVMVFVYFSPVIDGENIIMDGEIMFEAEGLSLTERLLLLSAVFFIMFGILLVIVSVVAHFSPVALMFGSTLVLFLLGSGFPNKILSGG